MKRYPFLLTLIPFLLLGCDTDGDGLSNAEEKELEPTQRWLTAMPMA